MDDEDEDLEEEDDENIFSSVLKIKNKSRMARVVEARQQMQRDIESIGFE